MKLDISKNVFTSDSNEILTAENLIQQENELLTQYPQFELSTTYWNVSFEYYRLEHSKDKIDIFL